MGVGLIIRKAVRGISTFISLVNSNRLSLPPSESI